MHDIQPVKYAKEILEILQAHGKRFVDITGRLTDRAPWTQEAIDRYYPNIADKIYYLDAYKDVNRKAISKQQITKKTKSEICREI